MPRGVFRSVFSVRRCVVYKSARSSPDSRGFSSVFRDSYARYTNSIINQLIFESRPFANRRFRPRHPNSVINHGAYCTGAGCRIPQLKYCSVVFTRADLVDRAFNDTDSQWLTSGDFSTAAPQCRPVPGITNNIFTAHLAPLLLLSADSIIGDNCPAEISRDPRVYFIDYSIVVGSNRARDGGWERHESQFYAWNPKKKKN